MDASELDFVGTRCHPTSMRVAEELGSPVVEAKNQPGGFSPGVAARCALADGTRCFIKAVSPDQNPDSARMYREEAAIVARLPVYLPAPKLRALIDDGHWIVLVFEEIRGSPPALPWTIPRWRPRSPRSMH